MEYLSVLTSRVIITPSPQVKEELIHVYHIGGIADIIVVPNGVEAPKPGEPDREKAKKLLGFDGKLVVFTTAQHVARKRLETLIEAAKLLESKWRGKAVIVIGGRGPLTSWLQRLAKDKGLNGFVVFTGWIPQDRLSLYYRAADVFVITSEYEAGPITLLEAGIRGAALVSTRIPGLPALLHDGENALLFDVGDYEKLAYYIDILLSDEDLRRRLGRAAIKFAERFTWDKVAELTESVYRRVLAGS
jgi:glycosyltransferase involved in cell wall biosynthesis